MRCKIKLSSKTKLGGNNEFYEIQSGAKKEAKRHQKRCQKVLKIGCVFGGSTWREDAESGGRGGGQRRGARLSLRLCQPFGILFNTPGSTLKTCAADLEASPCRRPLCCQSVASRGLEGSLFVVIVHVLGSSFVF